MRKVYCDICGNKIKEVPKECCRRFDEVKRLHSKPMPETPLCWRIFHHVVDLFDLCENCHNNLYDEADETIKDFENEDGMEDETEKTDFPTCSYCGRELICGAYSGNINGDKYCSKECCNAGCKTEKTES